PARPRPGSRSRCPPRASPGSAPGCFLKDRCEASPRLSRLPPTRRPGAPPPIRRCAAAYAPRFRTRNSKLENRNSARLRWLNSSSGPGSEADSSFEFPISIFEFRVSSFRFKSQLGQLIQAVKGCSLVAFGQGRIIEDRVHEVFDRAFQDEDRLADVEKLGRAVANDVNAQQLLGLAMEDELQPAGGVPHDLPARDLAIVSDAYFVGHILFRELLL